MPPTPTPTRQLARFVFQSRWTDLPASVQHEAVRAFVNWVGCAHGGSLDPAVESALPSLEILSESRQCTVIGRETRLDPLGAALRRQLAIWVGGEEAVFHRYEPVLRAMGDHPTHVGPIGSGFVTKLVHNCAAEPMQAALAETFVLGVKAGAEPLSLWEAIRQGAVGRRRTFDGLADQFLPGNYDQPQAAQRSTYKDMLIATELARELRIPMRFAALTLAEITESMNRGWAERDCRSVMLLPQERAGVKIAVSSAAIQEVLRGDPAAPSDTRMARAPLAGIADRN